MDEQYDISHTQSISTNKVTEEDKLKYLKNIHQKCKWYNWLHTKTYYYMYKIYICVHIPMILINTITAMLNTNITDDPDSIRLIRYCSAVILLMNTFFSSVLNLLKLDKKLEYHKNKASNYLSLSSQIEEYITIGDETETTIRLYKTYLSYSTDNEFMVPEQIIKNAEKTLNKKYIYEIQENSCLYVEELISEIKKENNTKIKSPLGNQTRI